jgi:Putative auto-transporter adhesin, head GIN domain
MKLLLFVLAPIACLTVLLSCRANILKGEGQKGTRHYTPQSFSCIDIDKPVQADIMITEGAAPRIDISGYENILKHLVVKVVDNKLRITDDLDDSWQIIGWNNLKITITTPSFNKLMMEGAAEADVHGKLHVEAFRLEMSGACKADIDTLNASEFTSDISGAGSVEVFGGAVHKATYGISGAGKVQTFSLQADVVTVDISGAGKCQVTALQQLTSDISGAASVSYKGHPKITKSISGAGSFTDEN